MDVQEAATSIVKKLKEAGFIAYFAGGWVRDVILHHPTGDIDIATDAPPERIMQLFDKTIPVGAAFGVIMVILDGMEFEISTFRKDFTYSDGRKPDKIEYSNPKEDALRRDFTINGMFYDPLTLEVLDYVGGMEDLRRGVIRTIGDPNERFGEDRLRMIRAVRFSCRFHYEIEEKTKKAIEAMACKLLPAVSMERIWQEFEKMRMHSDFHEALCLMHSLHLLSVIFPCLKETSLEKIKEATQWFSHFPEKTPTIIFIMELFQERSLEEQLEIGKSLRISSRDLKLVEFFYRSSEFLAKPRNELEPVDWARFYAHPDTELFLECAAVKLAHEECMNFLHFHEKQQVDLFEHIERIRKKRPLVDSSVLGTLGIKPGPILGKLLRESERICVNNNLHCVDEVIKKLLKSPQWPCNLKKC